MPDASITSTTKNYKCESCKVPHLPSTICSTAEIGTSGARDQYHTPKRGLTRFRCIDVFRSRDANGRFVEVVARLACGRQPGSFRSPPRSLHSQRMAHGQSSDDPDTSPQEAIHYCQSCLPILPRRLVLPANHTRYRFNSNPSVIHPHRRVGRAPHPIDPWGFVVHYGCERDPHLLASIHAVPRLRCHSRHSGRDNGSHPWGRGQN